MKISSIKKSSTDRNPCRWLSRCLNVTLVLSVVLFVQARVAKGQGCSCTSCATGDSSLTAIDHGGRSMTFNPPPISSPMNYAPSGFGAGFGSPVAPMPAQVSPLTPMNDDYSSIPIVQGSHVDAPYQSQVAGLSQIYPASSDSVDEECSFRTLSLFGGWNRPVITNVGDLFSFSSIDDDFTTGVVGGIAFGHRFTDRSRVDLEFAFRQTEAETSDQPFVPCVPGAGEVCAAVLPAPIYNGNLDVYSAMANFYFDFPNKSRFTPYIGAGIGYSYVESNLSFASLALEAESNSALAYQAMAGLSMRLSGRAELFAEYRFFATEDITIESTFPGGFSTEGPYQAHNVIGGLRFEF